MTRAPQRRAASIISRMAGTGSSNVMSTASARSIAGSAARTFSGRTATSSSMCQTIADSPSSPTKHKQTVVARVRARLDPLDVHPLPAQRGNDIAPEPVLPHHPDRGHLSAEPG